MQSNEGDLVVALSDGSIRVWGNNQDHWAPQLEREAFTLASQQLNA